MRFYLIGAGFISRTHAEAIYKKLPSEEVELKVAEPFEKSLAEFIAAFPNAIGYGDAAEMLSESPREDDIVIVGTPPAVHFELAMLGLASGRHVLCEKPLVMDKQQSELLLQEAKSRSLWLGCCSNRFLGDAKIEAVRELLGQRKLGEPYKATFIHRNERGRPGIEYQPWSRWFLDRSRSGGGVLIDWGPYDIALLNQLFAPVQVDVLSAWTARPLTQVDPTDCVNDVEQHVAAMLRYHTADGKQLMVHYERCNVTHGAPYTTTEIEGTEGAVSWDSYFSGDSVTYGRDLEGSRTSETHTYSNPEGTFGFMDNPVRYFIDKVKSDSAYALVNEQAAFNFQCMMAIYACAETREPQTVRLEGAPV
ncbi:Gfo/Idh/MocA family protein [Cohnella yongneupensis]|uniref:Gfo/Idh/MocA family protein n=1 Tax=Cohnella yongneupensis TaxID=425006 RepID=A0ABW0QY41_9BACL